VSTKKLKTKNYFMKASMIGMLLLLLFSFDGNGQKATSDSLKHLLNKEKQDTSQVLHLAELSRMYLASKPDTSWLFAQMGLSLARKIKYERGEAGCLRMIGIIMEETGNYPNSLEILLKALKIYENINDIGGMAHCNINIGNSYEDQGDLTQGLLYYFKAKPVFEAIHDDRLRAITSLDIGNNYEHADRLDSALIYTQQVYNQEAELKDTDLRGLASCNLGNIFTKMKQDDIAMGYYRQSIPDIEAMDENEALCEATLGMAGLFKKSGHYDSALFYAHWSLAVANRSNFPDRVINASKFLTAYYEDLDLVDSAYAYQKISIVAKDSLFNQAKEDQLRSLTFTEEMRQHEKEEAAALATEKRKRNIQMTAIGVFIPFFFGAIMFISKRRTKSRAIKFMGLLGLLLLFEFIALLIHPYIEEWTHGIPVLMLLILVVVASLLVPMHHKLEHWVKEELALSHTHAISIG
jgi:tetratricopeptide (TPR) repeat protein